MSRIVTAHVALDDGSDLIAEIANLTPYSLFLKTLEVFPFRTPVTVTFFSVSIRGEVAFVSRSDPSGVLIVFHAAEDVRRLIEARIPEIPVLPVHDSRVPIEPFSIRKFEVSEVAPAPKPSAPMQLAETPLDGLSLEELSDAVEEVEPELRTMPHMEKPVLDLDTSESELAVSADEIDRTLTGNEIEKAAEIARALAAEKLEERRRAASSRVPPARNHTIRDLPPPDTEVGLVDDTTASEGVPSLHLENDMEETRPPNDATPQERKRTDVRRPPRG
jgi:hypothetical protein